MFLSLSCLTLSQALLPAPAADDGPRERERGCRGDSTPSFSLPPSTAGEGGASSRITRHTLTARVQYSESTTTRQAERKHVKEQDASLALRKPGKSLVSCPAFDDLDP